MKKVCSEGPDPDLDPKFQRGDEGIAIRRFAWSMPQPGVPLYKKDVTVGTEGVVEGWADLENRQVLLSVVLDLPSGKNKKVTKEAYPTNLKLTSDYNLEKTAAAVAAEGPDEASGSAGSGKKPKGLVPEWALLKSDPDSVKVLGSFKNLLADQDKCMKAFLLKARVGVTLQALGESLPVYADKDFQAVLRQSDKGIWKG